MDLLHELPSDLSVDERKVTSALLANYPVAGPETEPRAQRADVAPPTAVRVVSRLGISSHPAFQARAAPRDLRELRIAAGAVRPRACRDWRRRSGWTGSVHALFFGSHQAGDDSGVRPVAVEHEVAAVGNATAFPAPRHRPGRLEWGVALRAGAD